ncbi:copper amine oxidase-like protein [Gottschalkia acidurici 9a]|uniref:Copper amine oxidase-like protein n=1 Tax=Gottschalkia acidurici (strain ATCC 7906 / DSM 604 / BCRC 14475 / CIP 104303 / KCTC 5404 / NCIMB 10678 / 9a) TaxID=1128398 RepID=K0B0X4_GOTA9|nr:copper amine oxidase N-terminal domain-containing protein [Gottschalkia acidurici]AFS78727.1 copper amine oxidase-like protein [Gottschalkia acidurici 9a]
MRRYLKLSLIICFLIILPGKLFAQQGELVEIQLDQKKLVFPDAKPLLIKDENRVLVPVRFVGEQLGAVVYWDKESEEVHIFLNNKVILVKMGSDYATINNNRITLDSVARIIDGRTYVPLRFISESLDCSVDWDGYRYIAYITTKENTRPIIEKPISITATGDMYIDEQAVLALDSNFNLDEYHRAIYSYTSDWSKIEFIIDFSASGGIASTNIDGEMFKPGETQDAFKKVLRYYFSDKTNDVWRYLEQIVSKKKSFKDIKEFGDRSITVIKPDEDDRIFIFIN